MIRVNKTNPCKICKKPDWCMYSEDGQVAICSRVSEGSKKRSGDAGWLHVVGADTPETVRIDLAKDNYAGWAQVWVSRRQAFNGLVLAGTARLFRFRCLTKIERCLAFAGGLGTVIKFR